MYAIDDGDAAAKELTTLDGLAWAAWAWVGAALIGGGGSAAYLCLRSGSRGSKGHPDLALGLIVLLLAALLAALGAIVALALRAYIAPRMLRLVALRKAEETAAVVDEGW